MRSTLQIPTSLQLLTSVKHVLGILTTQFSPKIFKYCAIPLLQVVFHLFCTSLSHSSIPQDWQTHCVIPVYKSGDKTSVSNYRPISLLRMYPF